MMHSLLLLGEGLVTPERLAGAAQDAPFQLAHERRAWLRLAQWGQGAGRVEEWQEWREALRRAPPATAEPLREQTITLRLTFHRAPHIFAPHILPLTCGARCGGASQDSCC